jgi:Tol biopolymer transport system component
LARPAGSLPYGSIGEPLPVVEHAAPNLVAWGPTNTIKDQYLYSSGDDPIYEGVAGIYLNTVGDTSGGTKLVNIYSFDGQVPWDIEWLPDASGFLFTLQYVPLEIYSDVFEYNFTTEEVTQLTDLGDNSARGFSISPDGQQVVFERVDEYDSTSNLWILDRDDLDDPYKLIDDAGRPAWGLTPVQVPITARSYLPVIVRR